MDFYDHYEGTSMGIGQVTAKWRSDAMEHSQNISQLCS